MPMLEDWTIRSFPWSAWYHLRDFQGRDRECYVVDSRWIERGQKYCFGTHLILVWDHTFPYQGNTLNSWVRSSFKENSISFLLYSFHIAWDSQMPFLGLDIRRANCDFLSLLWSIDHMNNSNCCKQLSV